MTQDATDYMLKLAALYFKHGDRALFDAGNNDDVHLELEAAGLIRKRGTRQGSWMFTEYGVSWILANQAA